MLSVRISSYGCTREVWRVRKKRKAAFTRQTKVGKLKLMCVSGTKTVGKQVGKLLATNRTCLYSRQLFQQLFRVGKLVSDV